MLKRIKLQGFLSFAPDSPPIELSALNVLIGPNGSGKSNFVEALAILRAVPTDLPKPIRQGGGIKDWLWCHAPAAEGATVEVVFQDGVIARHHDVDLAVRYRLSFGAEGDYFTVLDERVENESPDPGKSEPFFYFGYSPNGRPMLNVKGEGRQLRREDIDSTQSILSQRRDPESYPEVTRVADYFRQIVIYRSWSFGPQSALRAACPADIFTGYLLEDFSNLPARLAVLKGDPKTKRRLIELLQEFSAEFTDFEIVPEGGRLQLYLQGEDHKIPARRLSDGTLRFLCLIAILVKPPLLVVIEEPELGLHPDILPTIRDLLIDASKQCQLIVCTHSTQLIDAMTDHADSVLICEKENGATHLTRLSQAEIERWREYGSLGKS